MLVVNLDLPARTVAELIELLKKNPGKYSYGSAGTGTTLHLSGELFKVMAKVDMLHVPYRGAAPAMQDLLAGQVHMIFDNIPGTLAQYRPGKVRALGVTSKDRTPVVPEIPAIAETLPGFDINSWTTLTGPAKLPPELVARLSELVQEGARERRPQGQVRRSRGDGHLALAGRHAGLPRFGGSAARPHYPGVGRACRLAACKPSPPPKPSCRCWK